MDDDVSLLYKAFPAPYVAQTAHLIGAASGAEHRAFYRAGSDTPGRGAIDFFSAGSFVIHQVSWPLSNHPDKWRDLDEKFANLDCNRGPLTGYLSYEAGFAFEPRKWHNLRLPTNGFAWRFMQLPYWYEANHLTKSARICVMDGVDVKTADYLIDLIQDGLNCLPTSLPAPRKQLHLADVAVHGEFLQGDYEESVRKVLEDISAGRYYELNLTQRFHLKSPRSPGESFTDLFHNLEPQHGFFCDFQDEAVVSASPELFLRKVKERVSMRPIKGSMISTVSEAEKEKLSAEHVMVVDLARNDLGRVSNRGWVAVDEFQVSGRFGGLTHLESLVSGTTSMGWQEILANTFPAASITGMPKVITVEAIAQYENSCRGVYTGACGWVCPGGDFDFNVAIRTLTATQCGGLWHYKLGAGGAIVADSDPGEEFLECLRKAQPILSALQFE